MSCKTKSVPKLSYSYAAAVLVSMGIVKRVEFNQLNREKKRPAEVPAQPEKYYKDDYVSWRHFIAAGQTVFEKEGYAIYQFTTPTFKELRSQVRARGIASKEAFVKCAKQGDLGPLIPSNIESYYEEEFTTWDAFLAPKRRYMCYEEAKAYVATLNIRTSYQWSAFCKAGLRPESIPAWPNSFYDEFVSWRDFFS